MVGRDVYAPLVQLLNPKLIYVGNDNSLPTLDALQDIYALVIYDIELSREKQANKFLIYLVHEFNVGD